MIFLDKGCVNKGDKKLSRVICDICELYKNAILYTIQYINEYFKRDREKISWVLWEKCKKTVFATNPIFSFGLLPRHKVAVWVGDRTSNRVGGGGGLEEQN